MGFIDIHVSGLSTDQYEHIKNQLTIFHNKLNKIEMTNADLLALLKSDEAKLDTLITDVQTLVAKIGTTPDVPQDIVDEANALGTKLDSAITTATPAP